MKGTIEGLVGRSRECAELTSAFDEAAAGRGGVVLLVGEPGIGKTSVALAFSEWASARGGVVCWGRAWEAGGAPAFWPWIEVLREIVREPAPFADLPGLPEIASLIPEVRERLPTLGEAPAADPAQGRFRLFDAVSALLRRASERAPLAIVLDDLHAADVPSLELLRFLSRGARRSAIAIVGTYRDAEARLSEAAGAVFAKIEREARVLRLDRLGREDVGVLVARASGGAADEDLVSRLAGVTEGNPLFVVETLRLLRAQGAGGDRGTVPLAGGVREVIRERLAGLPDAVRAVVEAATVLGRDLDPALLAVATGLTPVELQGPLEVALAADVLTRRDERLLSFSHILLREVPYRSLHPERRARLHLAVADALERRAAAGGPVPVAELAHHAFEAAPIAGLDRAITWATQAAARAMSLFAFEDAVPLLERSLEALRGATLPGDDVRRCDLLLALGEARIRAGLDRKGRDACEEAAALARRLGDTDRLVRAALGYGEVFQFAALDRTLTSLLEESLAALGPGDRPSTARVLARLAAALQPGLDPAPPMVMARDAIAMARRLGDDRCRLDVLHAAISALLYFAEPAERMELNAEQVALAGALGDKLRRARAHLRLAVDHLELGDVARADANILEYERVARELRLPAVAWHGPMLRAMRALLEGRFAEAEEKEAEARGLAALAEDSNTILVTTMFRMGLYWTAARHEELALHEPRVRELESVADGPYIRACMAGIQARLGRAAQTRAELARIVPELGIYDRRLMAAWVAEAVAFAGERPAAEHLYGSLAAMQHRNHSWGMASMVCDGPVSGIRGVIAAKLERWDEAERCFAAALARTDAMGARPAGARTRFEWARALVQRGAGGDALRARGLVDEARRTADELDLPGLRVPLEELAASLAPTRASAPPPERVSEPAAALPIPAAPTFSLTLEGEVWTVTCGDDVFRLKDSKGLQILSQLVQHPGREFHVTDLVAPAGVAGHVEDAGDALDREAAAQYRQRAKDVQEELREAEQWGDAGRAGRLREELEFLASELSRGLGLGGRSRKAASTAEKARVNVQRRLKDAIQRITDQHAALGQHLERAVKTGTFCSYS